MRNNGAPVPGRSFESQSVADEDQPKFRNGDEKIKNRSSTSSSIVVGTTPAKDSTLLVKPKSRTNGQRVRKFGAQISGATLGYIAGDIPGAVAGYQAGGRFADVSAPPKEKRIDKLKRVGGMVVVEAGEARKTIDRVNTASKRIKAVEKFARENNVFSGRKK